MPLDPTAWKSWIALIPHDLGNAVANQGRPQQALAFWEAPSELERVWTRCAALFTRSARSSRLFQAKNKPTDRHGVA